MSRRFIASILVGATMLAVPAFATTSFAKSVAERCTTLEQQFDTSIGTHATAPKAESSKQLRIDGGKLCAAKEHAAGVAKLEQALKDLGLKPAA